MAEENNNATTASAPAPENVLREGAAAGSVKPSGEGKTPTTSGGKGKMAAFVGVLFNSILLCGIGYIGYLVYEQDKAVNVLFEQQNDFSRQRNDNFNSNVARIDSLQTDIQELQSALVTVRQETTALVEEQATAITRLQNELVSTRLRINSTSPGASKEWLLAEAASLLRLARQHLVVARNIRTAQALYIAADDVLKQVDDPAIFSVREILAGELAAIRTVTEVDVSSLYLQLGATAVQLNNLQVSNDLATQIAAGEPVSLGVQAQAEEAGIIRQFFSRVRNTLNNLLVVRRRDEPIQPLMTPGQEAALMQTIRLQIEQGRTALLKGEQEIYTTSLEQARNNIATYLAGDEGTRNSILTTLDSLRARRIVTEVPPLNRTLSALEQILSARDSGSSESAGNR